VPPPPCSGPGSPRCATPTSWRTDPARVSRRYRREACATSGRPAGSPPWAGGRRLDRAAGAGRTGVGAGARGARGGGVPQARTFALAQLARTDRRLAPGPRSPRWRSGDRPVADRDTTGWLAGFWPGRLLARLRARRPAALGPGGPPVTEATARRAGRDDTTAHDLGFLIQTSFGRGATLVGAE
jgi:hypothetical protein